MSKILSESVHAQSSQKVAPTKSKVENQLGELPFSTLFGGAANELSPKKVVGDISFTPTQDKNKIEKQLNSESLTLIGVVQSGQGLSQKTTDMSEFDPDDDCTLTELKVSLDENNPEAISASLVADSIVENENGGSMAVFKAQGEALAKMLFDDRGAINIATRTRLATESANYRQTVSGLTAPAGNGGNLGEVKLSSAMQTQSLVDFIGPMPAHQANAKTVSDLANLRALKASNLNQRNAEIDAEILDGEASLMPIKSDKQFLTALRLKPTAFLDGDLTMTNKILLNGDKAQNGREMFRANASSNIGVDSGSIITATSANSSSNGQTGSQTGQQTGGQTGTPTGGSLLNNLNALQNLDTARGNWTEMLLQRVQRGLAGGKDQLDFQLNPRNLGKMRVTLIIQNDRTNVQIQTETSAAASMLGDSEARLAQMLEASGLRLGNLNSAQFNSFGGNASDQHAAQQEQAKTKMGTNVRSGDVEDNADSLLEPNEGRSDNLINIQA
ncbi:flagellar hook-length control protein FliK [Candidatus Puniceispirillum sp.]|nr:flagellar hook-length control protein FliK [Candidatus Puniceispirillum sp.]